MTGNNNDGDQRTYAGEAATLDVSNDFTGEGLAYSDGGTLPAGLGIDGSSGFCALPKPR